MHFSSNYTRVTISPRSRPGGPETYYVQIILTVALEINMLTAGVNTVQLMTLIQNALNRHAGGAHRIEAQPYQVTWTLRVVDRSVVQSGRALGVSLVADNVLTGHNANGLFAQTERGLLYVSRIILGGGFARQALSPNRSVAQAGLRGFGNTAAHEVGHSQRIQHQAGTLMDDTNTERLDRTMSDAQVYEILQRHLPPEPDRPIPRV